MGSKVKVIADVSIHVGKKTYTNGDEIDVDTVPAKALASWESAKYTVEVGEEDPMEAEAPAPKAEAKVKPLKSTTRKKK